MADTYIDTLTEVLYGSMETIQSEPIGLLESISRNVSDVTIGSFGAAIESLVTGEVTVTEATTYTPTMDDISGPDIADTKDKFFLDYHVHFDITILPEHQRHSNNTVGWPLQLRQRILKGLRGARNTVEARIADAMYKGASRALGSVGTTPFASNSTILEDLMGELVVNGVPRSDGMSTLVLNTAARVAIGKLTELRYVNIAGNEDNLRRGIIGSASGFNIRESAGIKKPTVGTGANYLVDLTAGYAVGSTTIHVDTGTGTILAGDIVTFGSDTTQYVVKTGFAGDGDGDIVLAAPGLRAAVANNAAVAIKTAGTRNLAFHENAAEFASRAPDLGDDKAIFRSTISDELSGLNYVYSIYPGTGMQRARIEAFYGVKVWNPYMVMTLLG